MTGGVSQTSEPQEKHLWPTTHRLVSYEDNAATLRANFELRLEDDNFAKILSTYADPDGLIRPVALFMNMALNAVDQVCLESRITDSVQPLQIRTMDGLVPVPAAKTREFHIQVTLIKATMKFKVDILACLFDDTAARCALFLLGQIEGRTALVQSSPSDTAMARVHEMTQIQNAARYTEFTGSAAYDLLDRRHFCHPGRRIVKDLVVDTAKHEALATIEVRAQESSELCALDHRLVEALFQPVLLTATISEPSHGEFEMVGCDNLQVFVSHLKPGVYKTHLQIQVGEDGRFSAKVHLFDGHCAVAFLSSVGCRPALRRRS